MENFIKDLPIDEYHQRPELSKSRLSVFADCPKKYWWQYLSGKYQQKDNQGFKIGSAVHTLALEPELWKSQYALLPECDRRTKAGKSTYDEFVEQNEGKVVLSTSDYQMIEGMANSLASDTISCALLKADGYTEASLFFEHDGIQMKARPDFLRNDGLVVDLKTAKTANPKKFFYEAKSYHYDLSVAITNYAYEQVFGKPLNDYVFLVVEKTEPYCVSAFSTFDNIGNLSFREYGEENLEKLLKSYKECLQTNHWPSYSEEILPIYV